MIAWLLVGYMWLFVHRPHEIWTAVAEYRIVLIYMLGVAFIWILAWISNTDGKRPLGNVFTLAVLFYTVAITLSALFGSYADAYSREIWLAWLRYTFFFVILMTSVKTERDLKIVTTGLVVVFFLWMAHSYYGYLLGNAFFSAGAFRIRPVGHAFSNANDYGTMIMCALPLIIPLITLCKKYWHYLFVFGYILLTLRSMLLTGSRTAFIMAVALVVVPVLFSKYRFRLLPILLIAALIGWMSMTEEMQDRYRTIWNPEILEEANANMESRVDGFYGGLENWAAFPVLGVGPGQHGPALGHDVRAHNLAGEVAGELGTFGIIAFLFLLSCFVINHYYIWRNYKYLQEKNLGSEGLYCWRVSLAITYAVLMLLLQGLGLHTAFWFFWLWFGGLQALAAMILQEKVNAAMQGKLLPSLPKTSGRKS